MSPSKYPRKVKIARVANHFNYGAFRRPVRTVRMMKYLLESAVFSGSPLLSALACRFSVPVWVFKGGIQRSFEYTDSDICLEDTLKLLHRSLHPQVIVLLGIRRYSRRVVLSESRKKDAFFYYRRRSMQQIVRTRTRVSSARVEYASFSE